MRRSPFYAQPSYAPSFHDRPDHHNFFSNPYTPSGPQSRPSTRPQPRSVITIPVHDHHSVSPPSSSSHHPSNFTPPSATEKRTVDPAAAATRIQSHFRGFSIRRHHPLLHLRTIATSYKQLEALKFELERPGFAKNVKTDEKERLRFNEAVMAVILRLDAIEGSIPEVRLRRKEATKMAIKLQDAVDAIVMQEECEGSDVKQVDGTASNANRVVEDNNLLNREQNDASSGSNLTEATQEEDAGTILNGDTSEDANPVPDECSLTKDCVTGEECHHGDDLMSNIEKVKHDVKEMAPALMLGNRVDIADKSDEPGSECLLPVGACAAEKLMPCTQEEEVLITAEKESTCEEAEKGDVADVIPVEGVMSAVEDGQSGAEEEPVESLMSTEVGVGVAEGHESAGLGSSDRMLLQQLSKDCKQLKSMLSKLLVQSRVQSKVVCALTDRIETLEHQQQSNCPQHYNQMKGRDRRKPKKGLKK